MELSSPARRAAPISTEDVADQAWWARGDAPVRVVETLTPLVDGRAAMLAMCAAFLAAKETIWLADWDLHARLLMVRGRDQCAGVEGSAERKALVERLRAAGLDAAAIELWMAGQLRVVDVLGFAAGRGVDVRVLLWDPFDPRGKIHMVNNPAEQRRLLQERGVQCRLDKNSRSPLHVAQALHQKCSVVDGRVAFVGGVDLTVQYDGDFDRWDTPSHPFDAGARATDLGPAPHPWHDAHVLLNGAPAHDVERNIRQRWDEAALPWWRRVVPPLGRLGRMYLSGGRYSGQRALREEEQGKLPPGAGPAVAGAPARVQVVRTIPALTYRFAPAGIYGIAQAYTLAARRAQTFIYLESQYLWLESFVGIDVRRVGWRSHHMRALLAELAAAAERGVTLAVVLPDHPNCGRGFTDDGVAWLRKRAPRANVAGRLHFFTLAAAAPHPDHGWMRYRPVYVHAKVAVVDDRWATIGSANLNSRGMSHDAELNVAALDAEFASGLRMMLWAEHAGALRQAHAGWPAPAATPTPRLLAPDATNGFVSALAHPIDTWRTHNDDLDPADLAQLEDPLAGIQLLSRRASENLERLQRNQPLVGHLLPYVRHPDAAALGLTVDREHGLLDPLRVRREGVPTRHPNRYT
jgi:phosphatidylserine/phosphatidylglycerophosphate/cardiolipin synthase-like enzyme